MTKIPDLLLPNFSNSEVAQTMENRRLQAAGMPNANNVGMLNGPETLGNYLGRELGALSMHTLHQGVFTTLSRWAGEIAGAKMGELTEKDPKTAAYMMGALTVLNCGRAAAMFYKV